MSVRLMGAVFELEISAPEKLVLLAMADHARDDGTGCYPSIDLLARKTSQSRRGVQKIMRRLEEQRGLIAPSNLSRGRHTTEYRITLENREPRSLFGSQTNRERQCIQPRTRFASTANASASNREPGSPESLRTVIEPSGKPGSKVAASSPWLFENGRSESQTAWLDVGKLIPEACAIIGRAKALGVNCANGDCREELKEWAAANGVPYSSDRISKALTVAEGRAKAAAAGGS